jgi:hypothetical protein
MFRVRLCVKRHCSHCYSIRLSQISENEKSPLAHAALLIVVGGSPRQEVSLMNAFVDLAERQTSIPCKAQKGAAKKRAIKTEDRERLSKLYAGWRRERVDALIAGHGEAAHALLAFLDNMTIDEAPELIAVIEKGPWRSADTGVRFEILAVADAAIVRLREKHGFPPFDDPLPHESLNVFQIIKQLLR